MLIPREINSPCFSPVIFYSNHIQSHIQVLFSLILRHHISMSSSRDGIYEAGIVDPGIPNKDPTASFWQSELHPLANHQSPWPSKPVDVAVIGAGITGVNVARNLLLKRPDYNIVLIEARSLCSGATGRNGGHIKTIALRTGRVTFKPTVWRRQFAWLYSSIAI